jgi:hypothetical protein
MIPFGIFFMRDDDPALAKRAATLRN